MPEWVILVVLAVILLNVRGRCCTGRRRIRGIREDATRRLADSTGGAERERGARSRLSRGREEGFDQVALGLDRNRDRGDRSRERIAPAETPLQGLQRRFIDGALTMEQYEAELDKLARAHRL